MFWRRNTCCRPMCRLFLLPVMLIVLSGCGMYATYRVPSVWLSNARLGEIETGRCLGKECYALLDRTRRCQELVTEEGVLRVVSHPFYPGCDVEPYPQDERVAVVGATSVRGHGPVTVWSEQGRLEAFQTGGWAWICADVGGPLSPYLFKYYAETSPYDFSAALVIMGRCVRGRDSARALCSITLLDPTPEGKPFRFVVRPRGKDAVPDLVVERRDGTDWEPVAHLAFSEKESAYKARDLRNGVVLVF